MNIVQIAAVGICVSVIALCVKNIRNDIGQIITIAAVVIMIAAVVPYIVEIISSMKEFAAYSSLGEKYMAPILKITGIAYVAQIGSQLCEDSGEKAIASRVEAAGKIAISVMALPIAKEAFIKIMGILT